MYAFRKVIEHYSTDLAMLAAGTVMILFSMWWLYFDDRVGEELASERKAFVWGYGHYFVFAAATAVGALISVNVDVLTDHAEISLDKAVFAVANLAAPCGPHNAASFVARRIGRAEKQRQRNIKQPRDLLQIADPRGGDIALNLAEPANRLVQFGGHFFQRQTAQFAQRSDVGTKGRGMHLRSHEKTWRNFIWFREKVKENFTRSEIFICLRINEKAQTAINGLGQAEKLC